MDPFTVAFYGTICALLSLLAPTIGSIPARMAAGAAVGAIAPFALGPIRLMVAGY